MEYEDVETRVDMYGYWSFVVIVNEACLSTKGLEGMLRGLRECSQPIASGLIEEKDHGVEILALIRCEYMEAEKRSLVLRS
jgi:hypothetical protein